MSKYSKEELQEMAQIVCKDFAESGDKSFQLFVIISAITGIPADEVLQKIQNMADGNE